MHNYKLTIQHSKGAFINSEYFVRRLIYFSKDTSKNEDFKKTIVNYDQLPQNIQSILNGICEMFSKTSTVNVTYDKHLKISFLNSNSIIKILKENQISNPIKNNLKTVIFYLNNLK